MLHLTSIFGGFWEGGKHWSEVIKDDAIKFVQWATSKEYIELVAENKGWGNIPTGTRTSTYENQNFLNAANFADAELKAILSANPENSTQDPTPYVGVQFAAIPELSLCTNWFAD